MGLRRTDGSSKKRWISSKKGWVFEEKEMIRRKSGASSKKGGGFFEEERGFFEEDEVRRKGGFFEEERAFFESEDRRTPHLRSSNLEIEESAPIFKLRVRRSKNLPDLRSSSPKIEELSSSSIFDLRVRRSKNPSAPFRSSDPKIGSKIAGGPVVFEPDRSDHDTTNIQIAFLEQRTL